MINILKYFTKNTRKISKKGIGFLRDDRIIWKTLRQLSSKQETITDPYDKSIWVYSSVRTIAQNISRVPFKLYENEKTSNPLQKEEITTGELYNLLQNPNPLMTFRGLIEACLIFMENYGECFWILDREDITKLPKEIWTFNPSRFEPAIKDGKVTGWVYKRGTKESIPFKLHEIIFFRYFNPFDDIRGLAPLSAAQLSIDQDYFANEYNKNFFQEGAILSGVIQVKEELSDVAFRRLLYQFEDRHKGASKAHKVALLEGDATWKNMSASQTDLDFANLKKLNKEEILAAFRTNPVVLGDYSQVRSYEGIRASHKAFWQESLVPKIRYIEEIINKNFLSKLSGNYYGEFDLNHIEALRDDFNYKVQTAWLLHKMGFPINMINERLNMGMSEVSWGNTWWINTNLVPANSASSDEKKEKPDEEKIDTNENISKNQYSDICNKFNKIQKIIEKRFQSKLSRFLFEQRKGVIETLHLVSDNYKIMTSSNIVEKIFPVKENQRLKQVLQSLYVTSVKSGAEMLADEIGDIDFIFKENDFEYTTNSRLNVIPSEIVYIVKMQLSQALMEGIDIGDSISELIERIKKVYNFASSKAKEIAKVESAGAINDGRFIMMKRYNIKKHKWIWNGDDIHKNLHNKTIKIDNSFNDKNLRYPCDISSGKESLGCTCLTFPIIENKEEN